jgi:hypothetical protein
MINLELTQTFDIVRVHVGKKGNHEDVRPNLGHEAIETLHNGAHVLFEQHRNRANFNALELRGRAQQLEDVQCLSMLRTQTAQTDSALPDHRRSLADVPEGQVLRRLGCSQVYQTGV